MLVIIIFRAIDTIYRDKDKWFVNITETVFIALIQLYMYSL